jgi:hypothetical protein
MGKKNSAKSRDKAAAKKVALAKETVRQPLPTPAGPRSIPVHR